ncbi:tRNA (uracil-5-)-methyltransferase, partial [Pseudomonas savastanoi pv. glycinea str. race 4]
QLAAELNVSLIGRSKGQKLIIGQDYVTEKLDVAGRT